MLSKTQILNIHDFTESLQAKDINDKYNDFVKKYRYVDLLVIALNVTLAILQVVSPKSKLIKKIKDILLFISIIKEFKRDEEYYE